MANKNSHYITAKESRAIIKYNIKQMKYYEALKKRKIDHNKENTKTKRAVLRGSFFSGQKISMLWQMRLVCWMLGKSVKLFVERYYYPSFIHAPKNIWSKEKSCLWRQVGWACFCMKMHLPNINQPLEHVYDKMHFTTYLYRCQCYL